MTIYEDWPSKMKLFVRQGFFFINFDFKNGCKMNFRRELKNYGVDPEDGLS